MLSIKDGETIVLGGLLQEEDRKTRTTIPWIGDLPLIGNLISSFKTQRVTTEVILTITPHIVQNMTPPALSAQTFWSGTESTYATGPMFSTPMQKVSAAPGSVYGEGAAKGVGDATSNRSLAQLAVPDPVLAIRPDEAAVQFGKEIKLSIVDGRLNASDQNLFKLEYDPKILQFKRLGEAELVSPSGVSPGDQNSAVGTVAFRLARPAQRAPRSVSVVFVAKAPGVSPIRVELVGSDGDGRAASSEIGTGVVRVR
jgi:general secretion pathway protein D